MKIVQACVINLIGMTLIYETESLLLMHRWSRSSGFRYFSVLGNNKYNRISENDDRYSIRLVINLLKLAGSEGAAPSKLSFGDSAAS